MLRFGICEPEQYVGTRDRRRYSGSRVSYTLLDVGEHPTLEQLQLFEDISFTLRTSNGTFRTTFRHRFSDVDAAAMRWITTFYSPRTELRVQDRAVSHGLTSWEWAQQLFQAYPRIEFEASDALLCLFRLSSPTGEIYIVEPDLKPLQYIKRPFVLSLQHPELWRHPLNRILAAGAKRRFERLVFPDNWMHSQNVNGYTVNKISLIHPEAMSFSKYHPAFQFRVRSIFEPMPGSCHVLRTMNILNKAYFSQEQLATGIDAAFQSIKPDGIWIVGRTAEDDFANHVTILRRRKDGWEVLERLGNGSEIEELALRPPFKNRDPLTP
jgi:hypothetical protein